MTTLFAPVKREPTRARVYAAIREAIFTGKLKTGQRLAEVPLASEFQVSRAVVREALQQLAHDGLVELNSYKGARVVSLSPAQVDEILGLRLLLEAEAIRLAVPRLTDADKTWLRHHAGQLREAVNDAQKFAALDLEFHERIWELSGNETLRKFLTQLAAPLFSMGIIVRHSRILASDGASVRFPRGDHSGLVETLCGGNVEEAVEAIRFHIAENWKLTRSFVEKFHQDAGEARGGSEGA